VFREQRGVDGFFCVLLERSVTSSADWFDESDAGERWDDDY
jgi:hypothetical protein